MNGARIKYISSMLIFGSVGLLVRLLPLTSAQIALGRGSIGCLFLVGAFFLLRKRLSFEHIRADLIVLIISGISIGINWILLFQSYRYTTIATATICYYLAPVIVVLLSPLVLGETLNRLKIVCIITTLVGFVLITGWGGPGSNDLLGILYGVGAAFFYAVIILANKFLRHVTNMERTIIQLGISTIALLPYVLSTTGTATNLSLKSFGLLLIVGIVHTGLAYYLYFSGLNGLSGQTAALFSYFDPLTAILFSALFLSEPLVAAQIIGGVLILGSTLVNDLLSPKKTT
ncbi:MAG: DMT family transporter [Lachnospiraceae bacterium]|jgi:RarD protein|nr:DMT family transporter [Lachnospiraceae bacterium]